MKISLICTVLNEKDTVKNFLNSILIQSKKPDELVVVDGFSQDGTIEEIRKFKNSNKKIKVKLIIKKGNRSVGRNTAVESSSGDIIVCSDVGCTLDKNWIKNIIKPFENENVDVVAGFYKGVAESAFEKSLIPYALVMEDRVNRDNFLPATRSIAFKKNIWKNVGKFDENLSNNEDFAFAKKLKKINSKIVFAKDAIVYWKPRKNIHEAFIMFYRFAFGDAEAGIIRPKVILIFVRYIVGIAILFSYLITKNINILFSLLFLIVLYISWSILKNYKYVKELKAFLYLPLLQFTSDLAVLAGTSIGFFRKFGFFSL